MTPAGRECSCEVAGPGAVGGVSTGPRQAAEASARLWREFGPEAWMASGPRQPLACMFPAGLYGRVPTESPHYPPKAAIVEVGEQGFFLG